MSNSFIHSRDFEEDNEYETESPRGSNFLVSAVMILKRQKADLQEENRRLRERLLQLESHNAHFMNLSADRLLDGRHS